MRHILITLSILLFSSFLFSSEKKEQGNFTFPNGAKYKGELKARIALDAIKGQKTIAELASEYGVHANQISIWKKQLLDAAPVSFSNGKDKDAEKKEVERDHLYKKVGQLQIEVDWLKKKTGYLG